MMSRIRRVWLLATPAALAVSLFLTPALAQTDDATPNCEVPRTVFFADPELDDQNTLIRYLLYSNQFDTQGLVYQSAPVHWKGDGQGTPYTGENSEHLRFGITEPLTSWRWTEDERFIDDAVEIYAEVHPNLTVHADGYPAPEELQSQIYVGNIEFPGDISEDTPGSGLVKSLLLDDNPCPVWLLSGAGLSTIGRALLSIEEEYGDTAEWQETYEKVSEKAILSPFGDQDDVYADYIEPNWPDIQYLEMGNIWGYGARDQVLPADREYLSAAWTRENVSEVGPLGEYYRVWGDGKQLTPGDITDHFGFVGLNTEQLRELGYVVWTPPQEPDSWISEGDTPMFLNLISNGLAGHLNPSYGGWGGRVGDDINPDGVLNDDDGNPVGVLDEDYDAARFFGDAQRDFAARMQWTVTPEHSGANHNPVVEVVGQERRTVRPGETVTLTARAADPDGDHVVGYWWQYHEVDTYPGQVLDPVEEEEWSDRTWTYPAEVTPGNPAVAEVIDSEIEVTSEFTVPTDAVDGQTLHLIFEAADNGDPNLTAYQRVVLTIER